MFIRSKTQADSRERQGLISHFMLGQGDVDGDALAVTWVDVEAGARQRPHHHPEVQVYVIIQGQGEMQVGDEIQHVTAGDLIAIPSNAVHGIINTSETTLSYVSAATPAFDLEQAYDRGQLTPEAYQQG